MLLKAQTLLLRKARRCIGAHGLLALTLAAAACTGGDDPPSAAEGGTVDADAAQDRDASVSAEGSPRADASPDSDAASQQPAPDAVIDQAAALDVTGGDTEVDNAGSSDTTSEAQSEDVGIDSAVTDDALIGDAIDSAPDADASVPDDGANTVPVFANCTYTSAIGEVPYAIIDATLSGTAPGASACHCSWDKWVAEHRVLCGSVPPDRMVTRPGCVDPGGGRSIVIIRPPFMCKTTLAFSATAYPLNDWDALLAEQIAGHADSGSSDVHIDADGTIDGSPTDAAEDHTFSDTDSAAGD
jgi:hypothetical protein